MYTSAVPPALVATLIGHGAYTLRDELSCAANETLCRQSSCVVVWLKSPVV